MRAILASVAASSVLLVGCGDADEGPVDAPHEQVDRDGASDPARDPTGRFEPADPLPVHIDLPRSADELADLLYTAERIVRNPRNRDAVASVSAFHAQILYRQLARTPEWQDQVLRRMRELRPVAELHLRARRALRSVLTTLSDELPAWDVLAPPPVSELRRFYREAERVHGVRWELLAAINFVETGFGKIHGLSTAGAQGPMQFIASTWAAYGRGDVNDPHDAILGAANYLAANGGATGTITGPGVENALYRYNNHAGYVDGILSYAAILQRDPAALSALVRWQIIYLSSIGDIWLPAGYHETAAVPVREYVAQYPDRHLSTATN